MCYKIRFIEFVFRIMAINLHVNRAQCQVSAENFVTYKIKFSLNIDFIKGKFDCMTFNLYYNSFFNERKRGYSATNKKSSVTPIQLTYYAV